jgi:hypothetical protein
MGAAPTKWKGSRKRKSVRCGDRWPFITGYCYFSFFFLLAVAVQLKNTKCSISHWKTKFDPGLLLLIDPRYFFYFFVLFFILFCLLHTISVWDIFVPPLFSCFSLLGPAVFDHHTYNTHTHTQKGDNEKPSIISPPPTPPTSFPPSPGGCHIRLGWAWGFPGAPEKDVVVLT